MAQFKRQRLFSNLTSMGAENVIYDEMWVYKLQTDSGTIKQKYRIRYQKTDGAASFGFSEEAAAAIDAMVGEMGPAISCTLETWESSGWVRCLDWMGDPSCSMSEACDDINDQFKSFVTCIPIKTSFGYTSPVIPPKKPKSKDPVEKLPPGKKESLEDDTSDFDWI
jgi:hypothetical protein